MPRKNENFFNRETVKVLGLDCVKEEYQANSPITMRYIVGTNGHKEDWEPEYSRAIIAIQTSEDYIGSFAANGWRKAREPIETYPEQVAKSYREGGTVISLMAEGEDEILAIADTFARIASELKAQMRHRRNRKRYTAEEVSQIVERETEYLFNPTGGKHKAPTLRDGKGSGSKMATTQPAPASLPDSSPVDKT